MLLEQPPQYACSSGKFPDRCGFVIEERTRETFARRSVAAIKITNTARGTRSKVGENLIFNFSVAASDTFTRLYNKRRELPIVAGSTPPRVN